MADLCIRDDKEDVKKKQELIHSRELVACPKANEVEREDANKRGRQMSGQIIKRLFEISSSYMYML